MSKNKKLEKRAVPIPGEHIMVTKKNSKRKTIVNKETANKAKKKKRPRKGPTKKELRMSKPAAQCTQDVQVVYNWLANRNNMLVARIEKRPEGTDWSGWNTRYYTTPKMLSFLQFVSEQFTSPQWFGPEVSMIEEKGNIERKPEQPEFANHSS